VSANRHALLARVLAQGARIDGELVNAPGSLFHTLADRLSRALVKAGDIVVLSGLQGRELLLANLATWQLDAVPMVLPSTSADADAFPSACRITRDLDVTPRSEDGDVPVGLDGTAVLHLSSGSTDRPKIARRSAASVMLDAEGYRAGLALVPDDHVAVPVPLTHSFGWGVAFAALLSGCDIDPAPLIRAGTVARKADQGAVSVLALTAPLARLLVRTPRQGEAVLRAAMAGAGSVSDELNAAFL
jgi:non-ribosomal peptide synthetase component F